MSNAGHGSTIIETNFSPLSPKFRVLTTGSTSTLLTVTKQRAVVANAQQDIVAVLKPGDVVHAKGLPRYEPLMKCQRLRVRIQNKKGRWKEGWMCMGAQDQPTLGEYCARMQFQMLEKAKFRQLKKRKLLEPVELMSDPKRDADLQLFLPTNNQLDQAMRNWTREWEHRYNPDGQFHGSKRKKTGKIQLVEKFDVSALYRDPTTYSANVVVEYLQSKPAFVVSNLDPLGGRGGARPVDPRDGQKRTGWYHAFEENLRKGDRQVITLKHH